MGHFAGQAIRAGNYNTMAGFSAGGDMNQGTSNSFFGLEAGGGIDTGSFNTIMGTFAAYNTSGTMNSNTVIGSGAGNQLDGDFNTFLGTNAGATNTGNANVFLGYSAGSNELGSNKLYIDNSSTTAPLIWGDFSLNQLRVNGSLRVTSLAGAGNRMVIANANGDLSATALPTDNQTLSYTTTTGVLTISGGNGVTLPWNDNGTDLIPDQIRNIRSEGDFITDATNGVLNAGRAVNTTANVIGDAASPTITYATGDEDLYIEDDLEVVGAAYKTGGGNWTTISDERLKKNINSFTDGLSVLMKIDPITFQYNGMAAPDDGREFVGVRAQQIEEVAPYMVKRMELGKQVDEVTGEVLNPGIGEYLTYDGSALDYIQINAIKELATENQALKARIEKLE